MMKMTDDDTRYYEVQLSNGSVVRVSSLSADLVEEALASDEAKKVLSGKQKLLFVQAFKQAVRRGAFELKERGA